MQLGRGITQPKSSPYSQVHTVSWSLLTLMRPPLSFGTPFGLSGDRGTRPTKLGVERGQARPGLLGHTSMRNSAEESAAAVKFLSFVRHEQNTLLKGRITI